MPQTDILIIGSGAAGLAFAIKAAEEFSDLHITILTKSSDDESNTRYAQGGIAVVSDILNDSFQKHIDDTLTAGDGLCNPEIVELVVREGPSRLNELIQWGTSFDKDSFGKLALGKEGGHTAKRIVHARDTTGHQISQSLLAHLRKLHNVNILHHYVAVDLITGNAANKTCYGVYACNLRNGCLEKFESRVTLLATGGIGQVYKSTTNPLIATGDGIAMAHRAGATIQNMEFVQFHPTAFYREGDNPAFLISEAIRGFGAYLCTDDGKRFLYKYDARGELATRDIVAKAIYQEMQLKKCNCVFLDCRHLPPADTIEKFPTIYNNCLIRGYDLTRDLVPIAPAAHYLCGGITTDQHARTSLQNLYAAGECASTGLHGANRLASNSLLEALVFSHRSFLDVKEKLYSLARPVSTPDYKIVTNAFSVDPDHIQIMRNEVQAVMNKGAGIVRSNDGLSKALNKLKDLAVETEELYSTSGFLASLCELRNLVTVGMLIVEQSIKRKENKGGFFNIDLENGGNTPGRIKQTDAALELF